MVWSAEKGSLDELGNILVSKLEMEMGARTRHKRGYPNEGMKQIVKGVDTESQSS